MTINTTKKRKKRTRPECRLPPPPEPTSPKSGEVEPTGLLADYAERPELAAEFGVSARTLARWDRLRIGPPVTYVGRVPMYFRPSAAEWLGAREVGRGRRGRR
jgi:hypothetical protein